MGNMDKTNMPVKENLRGRRNGKNHRENLRCRHCLAFLPEAGECDNPLCLDKYLPGPVPSRSTLWRWARPEGVSLPGDVERERYGIPKDAPVEVVETGGGPALMWFDPRKPGIWGGDQIVWMNRADADYVMAHLDRLQTGGFVKFDPQEWNAAHPVLIRPLVDAPGVDPREVAALQSRLVKRPEPEPAGEFRFDDTGKWNSRSRAARLKRVLELFPGGSLDIPLDFTRMSDNAHLGVMTPRQYATRYLDLWGNGGKGHDPEAIRLAELIGVTLIAPELCPLGLPDEDGNKLYLFDYKVDTLPITAFAFDLNRHLLYAWPDDERNHKDGWEYMYRMIGYPDAKHNYQNWAIVQLTGGVGGGAHVDYRPRDEALVRQAVRNLAALLLRAGHSPGASLTYEVGREYQETTVGAAAEGFAPSPAPAPWRLTDAGKTAIAEILQPYQIWRTVGAASGTPDAKRAANQLRRAARLLPGLLASAGLDPALIQARVEAFLSHRDDWWDDFPRLLAEFALLKQAAHLELRACPQAEAVFGAGFLRLFGG